MSLLKHSTGSVAPGTRRDWDTSYECKVVTLMALGMGFVGVDRFLILPLTPVLVKDLHLDYCLLLTALPTAVSATSAADPRGLARAAELGISPRRACALIAVKALSGNQQAWNDYVILAFRAAHLLRNVSLASVVAVWQTYIQ